MLASGLWAAAARPGVLKVLLWNRYTANGHQLRFFNMVGCAARTNQSGAQVHPTTLSVRPKNADNARVQYKSDHRTFVHSTL